MVKQINSDNYYPSRILPQFETRDQIYQVAATVFNIIKCIPHYNLLGAIGFSLIVSINHFDLLTSSSRLKKTKGLSYLIIIATQVGFVFGRIYSNRSLFIGSNYLFYATQICMAKKSKIFFSICLLTHATALFYDSWKLSLLVTTFGFISLINSARYEIRKLNLYEYTQGSASLILRLQASQEDSLELWKFY